MFHKVACFPFDGIANHSDVIYVCFELEMSPGSDVGGGPTLLGAAKPYGGIIYRIPFSLSPADREQNNLALRLLYVSVLTAKITYYTFKACKKK